MELHHNLKPLLKSSGYGDDILVTCFQIELDVGNPNLDHLMWLSSQDLIYRNKAGKLKLKFPLLQDQSVPLIAQPTIVLEDVSQNADVYRKLFKGVRSGSMGDKNIVQEYLYRFCLEEDKTMNEIIKVTQAYIDYTDTQYILNADNFIYKIKDGKEIPPLRIAFDEQLGESEIKTYNII